MSGGPIFTFPHLACFTFFLPKATPQQKLSFNAHLSQQLLQWRPSLVRLYSLSWWRCLKIRGNKSAEEIIKINIVLSMNNSNLWIITNIFKKSTLRLNIVKRVRHCSPVSYGTLYNSQPIFHKLSVYCVDRAARNQSYSR